MLFFLQFQSFLSELYVYLIEQMHVGLNKVMSIEDQAPVPEPLTDSAQLKHFAREAEVNSNFELAAKYYQEVIGTNASFFIIFDTIAPSINLFLKKTLLCFVIYFKIKCAKIEPKQNSTL